MLFTQYLFLLFLAAVVACNYALHRFPLVQKAALIAASLAFFLSWGGADVVLFLLMLAVNYPVARRMHASAGRWPKRLLVGSIVLNLGTLLYFKYAGFFLDLAGIALPPAAAWAPLGLSFYTFHLISYHVDIYERQCEPGRGIDYIGYISFFPHLIAGPIVRCRQLMPQFAEPLTPPRFDWTGGLQAFSIGLFLKCAADLIAMAIEPDWTSAGAARLLPGEAWASAFLFSCQIFGDFAGYSYMAIGMARFLGYELPVNFNAPYLAASFKEFWQRWHITLSRFLRDYLYIRALGGNRFGEPRARLNIMVTMLLGGLWHGANWTFVAWGALHGTALVSERVLGFQDPSGRSWVSRLTWYAVVQLVVLVSWILFRAPDFSVAFTFFHRMADIGSTGFIGPTHLHGLALAVPIVGYHLVRLAGAHSRLDHPALAGALSAVLLCASFVLMNRPASFIYFEF
jgi:D-alanyl-lipoteichoic acid acyltransferase DltB (MBOAT superfamily)